MPRMPVFDIAARAFAGVALGAAVLAGCAEEARAPGTVVQLLESPPDSLDPRFALTANGQRVAQLVTPGLVTFDDRGIPVADLAESFRELDSRTLEFRLRAGLIFHDGSPLTSEDVKATLDALRDPRVGSPRAERLEPVERIEAPDARTVLVHLRRPFAPMLAELSLGILPAKRARLSGDESAGLAPIGAGPFRVAQVGAGLEELTLLPFEGYYRGPPAIPRLVFRTVRDETTRVLELLKGRADLLVNGVSPAALGAFGGDPKVRVLSREGTGYTYLAFNLRSGPTSDERVRRAVCLAIDGDALVRFKLRGLAERATGMLPPHSWAYSPTPGCRRDLPEAKRLLDAAGYPVPGAGVPRLRLSLETSNDRSRRGVAVVLQKQLSEAGIALDIRALEFGTFFRDVRRGNFEIILLKWAAVLEPDLLRGVFSSRNIPAEANHFAGWNRGAYANPKVDEVLQRATEVTSPEERRALYAEALALIDRDLPYVPLWHDDSVCVVSSRVADYDCSPNGFFTPIARARFAGEK